MSVNSSSKTRAKLYFPAGMLVHAIASMPAKNAGALMAVNAIEGAIPLIHGPPGCVSMRRMNSFDVSDFFPIAPCTNLAELDVVLGGEAKLYRGIVDLYRRLHPELIVVVPTCPTDMIGDDLEGMVEKAKKEVGCEVVYSTGEMIPGRPIGYHDVLNSYVEQLLVPKAPFERIEKSVNLVSFPIHADESAFMKIVPILEEMGVKINLICFDNTHLSDLYKLPRAELNIIDFPVPWVEKMKKYFGVDYLATSTIGSDPDSGNPFGIEGTARILLEIAERLGLNGSVENLIEAEKAEAVKNYKELRKGLEGIRIAVEGGFFFGLGILLLRDLQMRPEVLTYRSFFIKSHGMSDDAYNQIIEMDIDVARKYGHEPAILRDRTIEEEIEVLKEHEVELVICSQGDMARYNEEGIKTFDAITFSVQSLKLGFDSTKTLILALLDALNTPLKKHPLVNLIERDAYEPGLIPHWKKLGLIWRAISQGGDGGCLYG